MEEWKKSMEQKPIIDDLPTEEELYRDNDIHINFEVPEILQQVMDQLDDLYEKKQDLDYNLLLNDLNAYAKLYFLNNKISERQFHILLDKYGAW